MEAVVEENSVLEQSAISVYISSSSAGPSEKAPSAKNLKVSQIFSYNPQGNVHFESVEAEASDDDQN